MTDDERIARLTKLAQKVWPTVGEVGWSDLVSGELMLAAYEPEWTPLLTLQCNHPRALDALEAALTVLAGEPPQPHWVDELWGRWTAWAMQREAMAHEVKSTHTDLHLNIASTLRSCAAELRERAKEG